MKTSILLIGLIIAIVALSGCTSSNNENSAKKAMDIVESLDKITNERFSNALKTCEPIKHEGCVFGVCAKVAIVGEQDEQCIVRSWIETIRGEISKDTKCLVPKDYIIGAEKESYYIGDKKYEGVQETPLSLCDKFPELQ